MLSTQHAVASGCRQSQQEESRAENHPRQRAEQEMATDMPVVIAVYSAKLARREKATCR